MTDPVVMSFFLAVPVASLVWAVLCFSVALLAFCVQGTDVHGRSLLMVIIGAAVFISALAAVFFRRVWRGEVEIVTAGRLA